MLKEPDAGDAESEKAFAAAAAELAAELRMTDLVDLITFIRTENHPNLNDLVNSSAELYFKPGTLAYGWAAEVDMPWTGTPTVKIDLEFRNRQVTAFFNLVLEPRRAGVELKGVSFEPQADSPEANLQCVLDAIADARLTETGGASLQ